MEACGGVALNSRIVGSLCAQSGQKDRGRKEREDGGKCCGTWWLEGSSGWNHTQEHEPAMSTHALHAATTHTHTHKHTHFFVSCPTAEHIT